MPYPDCYPYNEKDENIIKSIAVREFERSAITGKDEKCPLCGCIAEWCCDSDINTGECHAGWYCEKCGFEQNA